MREPMGDYMRQTEWPTLLLLVGCYLLWLLVTATHATLGPWLAIPILTLVLVQHSSLQHEVLHGHPSRHAGLNEALVFPALGLWLPYRRFRDLHLKHHRVPTLTDPHDDPESFYLPLTRWRLLGPAMSALLAFNNTLLGRMLGLAPRLMKDLGVTGGFRTVINTGPDGGQEVYHLHMHVMGGPRPWVKG